MAVFVIMRIYVPFSVKVNWKHSKSNKKFVKTELEIKYLKIENCRESLGSSVRDTEPDKEFPKKSDPDAKKYFRIHTTARRWCKNIKDDIYPIITGTVSRFFHQIASPGPIRGRYGTYLLWDDFCFWVEQTYFFIFFPHYLVKIEIIQDYL